VWAYNLLVSSRSTRIACEKGVAQYEDDEETYGGFAAHNRLL